MFTEIKTKVQDQLKKITNSGTLFYVDVDKDAIWQKYLDSFNEEHRQGNNCNCCKSFIRQFAGIVGIKNGELMTLWDFETTDPEYANVIPAMRDCIHSLPVKGIFFNHSVECGTPKTPDSKRQVVWDHFHVQLPRSFANSQPGPIQATALDNKNVLMRSLKEISSEAASIVLELISQNSLYRGNEFQSIVKGFSDTQKLYKKIKNSREKELFCWEQSVKLHGSICRIRNSAIGTLLNDLSEGKDVDVAVTAYERVVAPTNYKRPTALVTKKMIADAKKRLEEMGLINSLNRRQLSTTDLTVKNAIFVDRAIKQSRDGIFGELEKDVTVNPKSFSKIESIKINDFVEKVLPTAKSIRVLVENKHLSNFVTLVGPEFESKNLFKWKNDYSWSYTGNLADSIKERVKNAGGNVNGVLRISLSWNNTDDLDLHLHSPNREHVYYPLKRRLTACGAILDVDANGGDGIMDDPVENIYWQNYPTVNGLYKVEVVQYTKRSSENTGFEVEIEFNGETYNFECPVNGNNDRVHDIVSFFYDAKKKELKIRDALGQQNSSKAYKSKEKWNIKTGQFQKVKAVCVSPNHWDSSIGNKHFMFFLDGCKTDESIRGFYNEFLSEELSKDRKVFEILGSKVKVTPSEDELSGLGFSDTQRNDLIVEVTGAMKRVLRVEV